MANIDRCFFRARRRIARLANPRASQGRFSMNGMTRALAGLLVPALFVAVAVAQPAAAQDKKAEKAPIRAQKILVDNDRVRVSESVFKPGEANPMMKRGYRVTRVLKGNTTVERITDGKKE